MPDQKPPSTQKSRNGIQASKSENTLGRTSPKNILLDQQKKLIQQNSNAQYQTIGGSTQSSTDKQRSASGAEKQPRDSKSQPPGSKNHQKIEKKQMNQSKSQNQLITYRGFIMTVQQ